MLCIKNALIHNAIAREPVSGSILIDQGKILQMGASVSAPMTADVFDASGANVYPGFIDAHCHLGVLGYGIGFEGSDVNELTDPLTPQLRAIDSINPRDEAFVLARNGGVTTVATGPGSGNVLGGTFAAIKTVGHRIDNMIVRDPIAMKCAFGENPKSCYRDKQVSTRMMNSAMLRDILFQAQEYRDKINEAGADASKRPGFNFKLHSLLPVLNRQIPLKAHAHQANDIFNALRIAREFNVDITLEHVTEGHLIISDLVEAKVPLAVGPTLHFASKFELQNRSWETPGLLAEAGCQVSIITDSPVICQEYLPLCAGLAVKAGMDPFAALQAITINPAKHCGIADRVGSLEIGKDADLVVIEGNPFELSSKINAVFINGDRTL